MNSSDPRFEEQLRAMLRRRSGDVHPHRPPWSNLVETDALVAVGADDRPNRSRVPTWVRPASAVASVVVVLLAGAIIVDRTGRRTADDQNADTLAQSDLEPGGRDLYDLDDPGGRGILTVPAAGDSDFVVEYAAPVYPVTDETDLVAAEWPSQENPTGLALDYLDESGIDTDLVAYENATDSARETDPDNMVTAGVYWSLRRDGDEVTRGTVFLRKIAPTEDDAAEEGTDLPGRWIVVGAMTFDLRVKDVQRDNETLSFAVARTDDRSSIGTVRVEVNGILLDEGDIGLDGQEDFEVPVPQDRPAVIRVQHVDPEPMSVGETTVPPLHSSP